MNTGHVISSFNNMPKAPRYFSFHYAHFKNHKIDAEGRGYCFCPAGKDIQLMKNKAKTMIAGPCSFVYILTIKEITKEVFGLTQGASS